MPDFIFPIQDGKLINALDANGQDIADANLTGTTLLDGVAIAATLDDKLDASALDTDGTMAADSDARIASQKATRTYIASVLAGVATHKGALDCSTNPNYPTALNGDSYRCSVAGKIGGASGVVVEVADLILCVADNAGGTQASVGASWVIGQANITGITAAGLDMMQAADADAQAALLSAFFLAIDAQAADVDPAGTDIALALAAKLPLAGGTMDENAVVNLFNDSKWQQSTPDKGIAGAAGFSIICSAGYEYKFANGYLFILSDGSSTVRKVLYAPATPTATDDTTLGYTTDTTWEMQDGTQYRCTDATATAAVWEVVPGTDATKLPLAGGTMDENAVVTLFNDSKWQQSTPDKGIAGTAGFSIICSVGYEYKFALGYLFILSDGSTTVRKVLYAPAAPTATDDTTLGYTTDTTWEMADGTLYECTDATATAAVWEVVPAVSAASTTTLTNKRITPRFGTATSSATPTINTDNVDRYDLTAQAADITSFTSNLSGTPTDGQPLWISVTGTAARAITWGASFESGAASLPTTTVSTDRLDVLFVWNAVTSKWRCVLTTATHATDATKLPLAGGTMDENAVVNLFNASKWQQSTPDKGVAGDAGFSIICSVGYEYKFALGYLFILSDGSSTVRKVLYAPATPTATDDTTLGYTTDTTWEMADGTQYRCTDATATAAVWEAVPGTDATKLPLAGGEMTGAITNDGVINVNIGNGNTSSGTDATAVGKSNAASGNHSSAFGRSNTASGTQSSALGYNNTASGTYSSAVGRSNTASDSYSSALGYGNGATATVSSYVGCNNTATSNYSSAVGYYNTASGTSSSAFGRSNTASATNSSAFGSSNSASGADSSAFGFSNTASGTYSSAFGYTNTASGSQSSAVGFDNTASGDRSSAFGRSNTSSETDATAVGKSNTASGTYSSAVGAYNTASATNSSAFGAYNTASGSGSSAVGRNNNASGNYSSAVGYYNQANGIDSNAVGFLNGCSNISSIDSVTGVVTYGGVSPTYSAAGVASSMFGVGNQATGVNSSALGRSNTASGDQSSAFGAYNTASGSNSSALGRGNTASGNDSSAVGYLNTASSLYSSAVGYFNTASADYSSAVGTDNTASGYRSSAVGYENTASNDRSSAVGYENTASGDHSSAFGSGNTASGAISSALGCSNTASAYHSSAFGYSNGASGLESSAVGYNNTASATNSSAVGVSNITSGNSSSAFGYDNTASATGSSAVGYYNTASGTNSSAFGRSNTASGTAATAVGYGNTASNSYSTAVGRSNNASGGNSSAFGRSNTTSGGNSSAVGYSNTASATGSSAVGHQNTASGSQSSAVGYYNTASGTNSSAVGYYNIASGTNSSAFGRSNNASTSSSSAFGYYVQNGTTKATELGQWDSATARNGAIRLHTTGMAALTVQDRATEYGDAAEAQTVTITRYGTTATVSLTAHGYSVGSKITVAGANEVAYNGNFTVTAVGSADAFNYTAASTPSASPATGTVTCAARLGSERDNRLARGMFAIRRDGLAFYLDYNDAGTIKNISLGTAA